MIRRRRSPGTSSSIAIARAVAAAVVIGAPACGGTGETPVPTSSPIVAPGSNAPLAADIEALAGVPAGACAAGFVPDGARGCVPVLPPAGCPPGEMAHLGETACRSVYPCADGTWGDVPVDADTQYVDAVAAPTGADGTAAHPWTTLAAALAAAPDGAIVALAAGTYRLGAFPDRGRALRIWGRCPDLVHVTSDLSLTDMPVGVALLEVHAIVLDAGLRLNDASVLRLDAIRGNVAVESGGGPIGKGTLAVARSNLTLSATAARVDVEDSNLEPLVVTGGATVSLRSSIVRLGNLLTVDTLVEGSLFLPSPQTETTVFTVVFGQLANASLIDVPDARAEIRGSVFDSVAVDVSGAGTATFDDTVVTNAPIEAVRVGDGTSVTVRTSRIDHAAGVAVLGVGANVTLDRAWISDTLDDTDAREAGRGLELEPSAQHFGAGVVRDTVFERAREAAVAATGAPLDVDGLVVRATAPNGAGLIGDGVALQKSRAHIVRAVSIGNARSAISSFGAEVSIGDSRFEGNGIDIDGEIAGAATPAFVDLGGNVCGDGERTRPCAMQSAHLAPPAPLAH